MGDEITKAIQAELLAKVLATIEDKSYREIYVKWLAKESGLEKRTVESFIRGESLKAIDQVNETHELYQLPKSVKVPIVEIEKTIEKYQLFMANNKIWMQRGSEPPYTFESVSNFAIEIIQHMRDEKFPMKLLRIKNTDNMEVVFDMPSDQINTPMSFDNAMTAHGNYFWTGGRSDHQRLRKYLFDKMGTGRKIDVLGWQPEGFWAWNNKASVADGTNIDINENGVFEFNKVTYYIPSANSIYKDNPYKYQSQKKAVIKRPNFNFSNYITQMMKVHRGHAITATLFGIASAFQDIVVHSEKFFPMLFLYGPASSGKDQLANCVQSFFGDPQEAINLEGGVSTIKAQVREFAQFSNMISQLSEYNPGDAKLDGVLKGLWDRRGYKRGNIDSHVGTDSIPILSSVIMTGNYTPDQ
ncbi:MAG: hypothetical protein LAT81_15870, partial [Oceanicaulis sp.]|nr:hypothetical protein [Oceanicaulis sp.]